MPHLYPHLDGRRIVLASQSPRRRELMSMIGLDVECMARDIDESWPAELEGVDVAAYVAKVKAEGTCLGHGRWKFVATYRRKVVAGRPLGRAYGGQLSLPALERELRAALLPGTEGLDIEIAIANTTLWLCQQHGVSAPWVERYRGQD